MSDLASTRSRFAQEFDANPRLKNSFFGLTHAEVGGQGPAAQQAFMESVLNRASARNKPLAAAITDKAYFPSITHQRAAQGAPGGMLGNYDAMLKNVVGGSNVANFATGNASQNVGFAGGPQSLVAGGERFGVEGPDQAWARKVGFTGSQAVEGKLPGLQLLRPDGSNRWANSAPPGANDAAYSAGSATQAAPAAASTGAQPNMAAPYSGPSPDDVAFQRKLAMQLMGQASDSSPVQHWTQGVARALNGVVGGMYQQQASKGEKQMREAGNAALTAAASNPDPTAAIGGLLAAPTTNELGQKIAGGMIQSKMQPKYGFLASGDNLFRTNTTAGTADVVATGTAKPTSERQNYKDYVAETTASGQTPMPFLDYQLKLKQAGSTAITNDMRGENAESKGLGEGAAKRANDTIDRAKAASTTMRRLSDLSARLDTIQSGKLAPAKATMGAWAKSVGMSDEALATMGIDPKLPGNAQSINAITSRMVVDMIGAGGFPANNFSDADREFLISTIPRISNEPRGNSLIIEAARRVAQVDVEKAKAQQTWRAANKGKSLDEFELEWATKTAKQDLLGDLRKEAQALIGASGAKPVNGFPAPAVEMLKAKPTPEARRQFDEVFGAGASARVLGGN